MFTASYSGSTTDDYQTEVVEESLWPTLPALNAFVHFCARDFESAVLWGKQAIELHPFVHLGRCYYAQALEYKGQMEEALAQYDRAWVLTPDIPWLLALKGSCLARMGRIAEATALLSQLERQRRQQYVDAYYMAVLRESLGDRDECLLELERAVDENSASLFIIDVDPKLDSLRNQPVFAQLRKTLANGPG